MTARKRFVTPLGELRLVRVGERTGHTTCYACAGKFDVAADKCESCGRNMADLEDLRAAIEDAE